MKCVLKYLYKKFKSLTLRKKNVFVTSSVFFNRQTVFEGANVVRSGSYVSDSMIGYGTYIGSHTSLFNTRIGRFCSIASHVKVVESTHPTSRFVSTSPMFFSPKSQSGKTFCKEPKFNELLTVDQRFLVIGNDVWIGENVIIKGGVRIGDGAVIAMGACVTEDVPPYAIVGGVPAKIIRYRFTEEQIRFLLEFRWWDKPLDWIEQNAEMFDDIEAFMGNQMK